MVAYKLLIKDVCIYLCTTILNLSEAWVAGAETVHFESVACTKGEGQGAPALHFCPSLGEMSHGGNLKVSRNLQKV